jgi:hypothetical protein
LGFLAAPRRHPPHVAHIQVDTQGQSRTFEALDALLIAISPAYVASMQDELHKRLADTERRWEHEELDEPEWID